MCSKEQFTEYLFTDAEMTCRVSESQHLEMVDWGFRSSDSKTLLCSFYDMLPTHHYTWLICIIVR